MGPMKRIWMGLGLLVMAAGAFGQVPGAAPRVALATSVGRIVVELDPEHAPKTVDNFLQYVKAHQYDGLIFHRVIPGFMIQGGGFDPQLKERSMRSPIVNEANNGLKNQVGTIAMARTSELNSATDEFFINVNDNEFLDHMDVPPQGLDVSRRGQQMHITPEEADRVFGYAVFGHVVEGMDVVTRIASTPTTAKGEFANLPIEPVIIKSVSILP
jgi:cyclophilin family peptidyl-prolyl cis-trans isomerase